MTDNPDLCPCEMLKRALAGENYEIVSELVDAHFAQLAEIERLNKALDDILITTGRQTIYKIARAAREGREG